MEDKVSKEQIEEWKATYGRVQKLPLAGISYYYRPLDIVEYMSVQDAITGDDTVNGELETVKIGMLYPTLPEKPSAGVVLKISDEILKISGFDLAETEPEEL